MPVKRTKLTNPSGRLDMSMRTGEPELLHDESRELDLNVGDLLHQINRFGPGPFEGREYFTISRVEIHRADHSTIIYERAESVYERAESEWRDEN